jgi:hypothetical protein
MSSITILWLLFTLFPNKLFSAASIQARPSKTSEIKLFLMKTVLSTIFFLFSWPPNKLHAISVRKNVKDSAKFWMMLQKMHAGTWQTFDKKNSMKSYPIKNGDICVPFSLVFILCCWAHILDSDNIHSVCRQPPNDYCSVFSPYTVQIPSISQ